MAINIFYSWQSHQPENRNFIRSVLDAAVKELHADATLEEAKRDIAVDQDTQGVPGSPSVADAILAKIRTTDVFVADLTFMPAVQRLLQELKRRETPNPNVMLEYGYALHALGDSKIIGVFNEAHGSPSDLPFDLAHRRWPIRFSLTKATSESRQQEKKALTDALKNAIRGIITQFDVPVAAASGSNTFQSAEPGDGIGRLRASHDYLCLDSRLNKPVWLREGPYSFLRFVPLSAVDDLGEVEAFRICQAALQPMGGMRGAGWTTGRHVTGAVSYWTAQDDPEHAWDAAEIFLTRELWVNDYYTIHGADRQLSKEHGFPYIPMGLFEQVFIDSFINFASVAQSHLKLALPIRVIAGVANVQGVRLAVDSRYFAFSNFEGTILKDSFPWDADLTSWSADVFDFLVPFFRKIYDIAGVIRPDTRTVGLRQR